MKDDNRLEILLGQAEKAAVSRDFDFAEKLLTSREVEEIAGKESPRVLSALGSLYMKAESFGKALAVFKRLSELQPGNTEALNRLGTIYRRMGDNESSLNVLLKAQSLGDSSSALLYNLGNTYKEMRAYEEAEKCFMQAIELNPNDTLAYNHIGTIEFLLGHYRRAIKEYKSGLASDPNHPFIHFNMARLYRLLGKNDAAEREYLAALKSRPNWQKALDELLALYNSTGELEKQAVVLGRLLSLDSKSLPALLESAANAERRGKFTDARGFFMKAIAAYPHNPLPSRQYARFLFSAGDYERAAETIEAYNAENPGDKSLMLDLAEIFLEAGRISDAERALKGLGEGLKDDARALGLLARLELARGEKEAARQLLKRIIGSDPSKIDDRKALAAQLAQAGLLEEAKEQLELFLKDNPSDPACDILLGAIHEEEGDLEGALARYAAAIEKQRDNMEANTALALLYLRMGNLESAVQLAGDAVAAQGARHGEKDLSLLQESLKLYEQAAGQHSLSSPAAAAKSIEALSRMQAELKSAAEKALNIGEPREKEEREAFAEAEGPFEQEEKESPMFEEEDEKVDIASLIRALAGEDSSLEIGAEDGGNKDEEEAAPFIQVSAPAKSELSGAVDQKEDAPKPIIIQAPAYSAPIAPASGQQPENAVGPTLADLADIKAAQPPIAALVAAKEEGAPLEAMAIEDEPLGEEALDGSLGEVSEYSILELLEYLKDALKLLPEEEQLKYRKSEERMIMEYLISRLSGKRGLLCSIAKSAYPASSLKSGEGGAAPLSETFSLLAQLSGELPDKDFANILAKHAEAVQGRLAKLEGESLEAARPPQAPNV